MAVMNKRRGFVRILLIGLAAALVLFLAVSMFYAKRAYDGAFSRHEKPAYSGYLQYSDVDEYKRSTVQFPSGNNTLTGYLFGEDNSQGLVVIAHGLGGGAEDYLAETTYFVDHGWRVLAYDCTGSHASDGKGTIGLAQSALDLHAALTYVESEDSLNDLPIMLYGHSWGGYAVTAVLNYDHQVSAVASIAGYNSPATMLREQLGSMMGPRAAMAYPFASAYQTMLFGSAARMTAVDGINRVDIPVMIIHGQQDEMIAHDGASIIAQRDAITNPNAVFVTRSAADHDGHNNLFLSDAATEYIAAKNAEYKQLYEQYGGEIPEEVKANYYQGVDRFRTSDLDTSFMDEVNRLFFGSIGGTLATGK